MNEPTIGNWYRVTTGPQRGQSGVCDLITAYPVGLRYRLTSESGYVGRFAAEQIEPCANPQREYVSKVAPEVRQQAMDMLTGRSS